MKRCFSLALILALFGTSIASPTLAESPEALSAAVEAEVTPAETAGDTGLTVEGMEAAPEADAPAAMEPVDEAPAPESAASPYARVQTDSAVFVGPDAAQALATVSGGSVVLILSRDSMTRVALYTERGMLTGYMDPACLAALDSAEHAAYMDAASGQPVALYGDNLELPLALVACAFAEAGQSDEAAPETVEPAAAEPEAPDAAPETVEPAATEPEAPAAVPEIVEPAAAEPETPVAVPETVEPAAAEPEAPAAAPETVEPAATEPEVPAAAPVIIEPVAPEIPAEMTAMPGDAAVMAPAADSAAQATEAAAVAAVPATGIRLNAEAITIGKKETFIGLAAVAVPDGSILPAVTWRSENPKYVKVDAATGAVTGVKVGSAHVYASFEGGAEAGCLVTVAKAPSKVALNVSKLTMGSGGMTSQLTWSLPRGGVTNSVTFSSNKPAVVTVDANGLITSVNPGTATITVKTHNGKSAKCKVTVVPAPVSIAFAASPLSLAVGQTLSIGASALAANGKATEAAISYYIDPSSPDAGCVALDPATGAISGVRKGQAVITAVAYNGVVASCVVTVSAAPASIQFSDAAITIGVKENFTGLQVEMAPMPGETEYASALAWTVSNKKIVRVDEATGAIVGLKKGSCTVTATTVNGLTASCSVTVAKAPGKLSLIPSTGTLEVGQTGQYKVKFSKGAGGSVTFVTSDPSIATIDDDGVVTAVSPGTVAIGVQSYNGKKAAAKLTVTKASVSLPVDENINVDSTTSAYNDGMSSAEKLEYVIYIAQTQKGKPYKYGGGYSKESDPSGFDCSGLVYWCFLHIGIKVEASAYRQGYDESLPKITNAAELKRGDIVCFNTNENDSDESDHTGIYLGNGQFIHASSSAKKVMVSTLASGYYSRTFSWGRRVLP